VGAAIACEGKSSYGDGSSGNVGRVGGRVPGARATGGGGGTHKLQRGAQRRRGPGTRGPEARAGSGWLKVKKCRGG
jgi:hypothetical protein